LVPLVGKGANCCGRNALLSYIAGDLLGILVDSIEERQSGRACRRCRTGIGVQIIKRIVNNKSVLYALVVIFNMFEALRKVQAMNGNRIASKSRTSYEWPIADPEAE
jgi:hypothetical protein